MQINLKNQKRNALCILIFLVISSCLSTKYIHQNNQVAHNQHAQQIVKEKKFEQIKTLPGFANLALKEKKIYCSQLQRFFKKYHWDNKFCEEENWFIYGKSVQRRPLVFMVWGHGHSRQASAFEDVTLIMCGVHGDEITPVKFCYDILQHFKKESLKNAEEQMLYKGKSVVLVPLANPDSFFKKYPTRTNANGVDINRNFPTQDWNEKALQLWKSQYRKDKRRYPGPRAGSEPETDFQVMLIRFFKPHKIISIHAPLTMLDYDGPESYHTGGTLGSQANELLIQMSKSANDYRIKNYPFFPGSLGNYAGNERNIPTFTFELPSSDARQHKKYWNQFKGLIVEAINHDLKINRELEKKPMVNLSD